MNAEQAEILKQFFHQCAELASETLTAFVESEEKQFSIATQSLRAEQPENELLTKKELAGRWKVCERTISNLQTEGLPSVPFGTSIRFDYEECLTWAKGRRIKESGKTNLRAVS